MIPFTPDDLNGQHSRTWYKTADKVIERAPAPVLSTFPGDWTATGGWTIGADNATMVNTDSGNYYLSYIWHLNQSVAAPVRLRAKCTGTSIAAPLNSAFSIECDGSYEPGGVQIDASTNTPMPLGTWPEAQFEARIVPTSPITYLYLYIFARYKTGTLVVRDLEVIDESKALVSYGEWASPIIDLHALRNGSPLKSSLALTHTSFYYGTLENVDNLNSEAHSISVLGSYAMVICNEPGLLSARGTAVANALIAKPVQLFGYASLYTNTVTQVKAICDRCKTAGYYGVFFDQAGYDYAISRATFNTLVDYAHADGLKVYANAWSPPDILAATVNATYNPGGVASHLTTGDWALIESFYSRSDNSYAGVPEGSINVVMLKYTNTVTAAAALNVKVGCLSYQFTINPLTDTVDWNNSYILALLLGLNGWAYGSTSADNYQSWIALPALMAGTLYQGALRSSIKQQASSPALIYRWEQDTDYGTLWLDASDNPVTRAAGSFGISVAPQASQLVESSNLFAADEVDWQWQTSADRAAWSSWTGAPSRYVRLIAHLRANAAGT